MTVVYTRTANPLPGKQAQALSYCKTRAQAIKTQFGLDAEIKIRVGGPVGQVITVMRLENLAQFEAFKRQEIASAVEGKFPTAPENTFINGEDTLWMDA